MSLDLSRFSAAIDVQALEDLSVHIIGCGNLGSHIAISLARLGVTQFILQDHDIVAEENIATQHYLRYTEGDDKVDALAAQIHGISEDIVVEEIPEAFGVMHSTGNEVACITIASLDNIETRQLVFSMFDDIAEPTNLFIDPRMAFEYVEINALLASDEERPGYQSYKRRLFDTNETYSEITCGASSMAAAGMFTAALVQGMVARYALGLPLAYFVGADSGQLRFVTEWHEGQGRSDLITAVTAREEAREEVA